MRFSISHNLPEGGRRRMGGMGGLAGIVTSLLSFHSLVASAVEMNIDDPASVKSAAGVIANKIMTLYPGNRTGDNIPGLFGSPYYWWEAGAVMGGFIDYWAFTGDPSHNPTVMQAMQFQVGENIDYEPRRETKSLGNDDQAFWGIAALSAAERGFPDPPPDKPQWLALAQAVFNRQSQRWDMATCNGGMRWQVVEFNKGFDYKNTISNGLYFMIGARLARYTGNATYAEQAEKAYDWLEEVGFIHEDYRVFDGANIDADCKKMDRTQWTYNAGILLGGAAVMYNYTGGDRKWGDRVDGLLKATEPFFQGDVMWEAACERIENCNGDQRSFKAYLSRFYGLTAQMYPAKADFIMPKLRTSAIAAARQCDGTLEGITLYCGMKWTVPTNDGSVGKEGQILGQHLSALEVIQNTLIQSAKPPLTAKNGGTSKGDPEAGTNGEDYELLRDLQEDPVLMKEKVGAVFVTLIVTVLFLGMAWFMVTDTLG